MSALENGIWFDGSSVEGFARIQESDMHLRVDVDSYAVLPWSPVDMRRARLFCDIYRPDGEPFAGDPRGVLKRQLSQLKERGWTYNVGPEPEFFYSAATVLNPSTRSRMMLAAISTSPPMMTPYGSALS
jgi:glutamine synthetase